MSTSILYQAYGIKGFTYTSTTYEGDTVIFNAEMNRGVRCSKYRGYTTFKGIKTEASFPFRVGKTIMPLRGGNPVGPSCQ